MVIALSVGTTTPIFDYTSLVSAVEDHLQRDDFGDRISRFVQLVETYLKREFRTLDMETTSTAVLTGGSAELPSDLLSIRSITIQGDPDLLVPDRTLRNVSPSRTAAEFSGAPGAPYVYTRVGNSIILTPPLPEGDEVTLKLIYLAGFVPLSAEAEANWILRDHPDVYFYGVLAHAYAWVPDPDNASTYGSLFDGAVEGVKVSRAKDRWGSGLIAPTGIVQVRGARC